MAHAGSSPEAWPFGCLMGPSHAGSWRTLPVRQCADRGRAGMTLSFEGLDDDHASAAAGAWRTCIGGLFREIGLGRRGDGQKHADAVEAGFAARGGKQAIMPDAVEAARQEVNQEAADELVGRQRHDLLALGAVAAIVLVTERHAVLVKGDKPPVGDGNAVSVAREMGQYRLRPGKGRFDINTQRFLGMG